MTENNSTSKIDNSTTELIEKTVKEVEKTIEEVERISRSDHPFSIMIEDALDIISSILDFELFTTINNQHILVSTLLFISVLFAIGIKISNHFSKAIKHKLKKESVDINKTHALERISYYFFVIIVTVFCLEIANIPLTTFAIIGTTIAVSIGMGSKITINNFVSGLILLIERPIKLGDFIETRSLTMGTIKAAVQGTVKHIGARCTTLSTLDNRTILIPNGNIIQDILTNHTHNKKQTKLTLNLQINIQADIEELDKKILTILKKHPLFLKNLSQLYYIIISITICMILMLHFILILLKNIGMKLLSVILIANSQAL